MKKLYFLLIICAFWLTACQQQQRDTDIRWMGQSVEYVGICVQTYRAAWRTVQEKAASKEENWAVVLDVDETVLNNIGYQMDLLEKGVGHSAELWDDWTRREEATAVPGAKTFLDNVRALGEKAQIVFITNRTAKQQNVTVSNMKKLGLWDDNDVIMGKKNSSDSKEARRREVIDGTGRCESKGPRKIIALLGDQLPDLEEPVLSSSMEKMRGDYAQRAEWSERFFMFPNPMYGYWERGYK